MNDPQNYLKKSWSAVLGNASAKGYKMFIVPFEDVDEVAVSYDDFYHWPEAAEVGEHVLFIGKPAELAKE